MKFRKNNKGFSLVELIIVIAIMVALIAVMAPQFTKYIQKSRDSALASAAEDYLSAVKTVIADSGTSDDSYTLVKSTGKITISCSDGKLHLTNEANGFDAKDLAAFNSAAGVTEGKTMGKSDVKYEITVSAAGVSMEKK